LKTWGGHQIYLGNLEELSATGELFRSCLDYSFGAYYTQLTEFLRSLTDTERSMTCDFPTPGSRIITSCVPF
jgi:hypothetical protein